MTQETKAKFETFSELLDDIYDDEDVQELLTETELDFINDISGKLYKASK